MYYMHKSEPRQLYLKYLQEMLRLNKEMEKVLSRASKVVAHAEDTNKVEALRKKLQAIGRT